MRQEIKNYHNNKYLLSHYFIDNNVKVGLSKEYYSDGSLCAIQVYKNGFNFNVSILYIDFIYMFTHKFSKSHGVFIILR